MVAGGERAAVVHADRQIDIAAGADVEPQPGIALAAAGQDEHHGPVGPAEDTRAKVSSSVTLGCGEVARMGVDPNPRELLGPAALIHLPVEEVGHGLVVEGHRGPGADLPHQLRRPRRRADRRPR